MVTKRKLINNPVHSVFREYFRKIPKPEEKAPKLPIQISHLDLNRLSDLQTRYTAWREYTEDLMTESLTELTRAKEKYSYEWDKKLLLLPKMTRSLQEAALNTDDYLHALDVSLTEAQLYHDLLTKKLESYTNCLAVISREITLRGQKPY